MRDDRRMILAIILGTSAVLAAWAGYWWSSILLGAKANRASRTASVISPVVIAVVLVWAAGPLVDTYGIDLEGIANWNAKEVAAFFFGTAVVLLIPTVLIAMTGRVFDKRTPRMD
jgi:hypothetical protein